MTFTANESTRRPLFRDPAAVPAMLPILIKQAERHGCHIGISCFMPDHLHVILCGQSDLADAKAAMDGFKHQTGLWLEAHRPEFGWQGDYYDHIIRKGDDWRRQVRYVYNNPVRRGLVADGADWPYTGAVGFDLIELLIDSHY